MITVHKNKPFEIRSETTNVGCKRSCPKPAGMNIALLFNVKKIVVFHFTIGYGHVRNYAVFFKANDNVIR